jgi:YHS domain-containing protein
MKTFLSAVFMIAVLFFMDGCKKQSPSPAAPPTEVNAAALASGEQTICPVMGAPVDKNIFIEYQGKKVYFCCTQCKGEFEKNPENYLTKLPQFKK